MPFPPKRAPILGGVLLLIVILILLTLYGSLGIQYLFGLHHITALYLFISRTLYWLLLLGMWLYASGVERQKFLIWPEINYSFWVFILSLFVIMAAIVSSLTSAFLLIKLFLHNDESSRLIKELVVVFKASPLVLFYTALTAGVTEELLFRGYLLPRLNILFKSPFLAIAISTLIFAAAHIGYGTVINVIGPLIIGLALAFYYYRYRNIKVVITFHFLWDLTILYLQTRHG
jgi:hypothetical protein